MIRNESEYQEAVRRIDEERKRLAEHQAKFEKMGLTADEVKRALDPLRSFHLQLEEEVESYERLKRGDFGELINLHGLGRMLVALRIALGLAQRELADRLGVHESQVSRDERNEYHGITAERASRILDAIGVEVRTEVAQVGSTRRSERSEEDTRTARRASERGIRLPVKTLPQPARFTSPSDLQLVQPKGGGPCYLANG
jgi:transcriptional regulator with XRE-family HTH domain